MSSWSEHISTSSALNLNSLHGHPASVLLFLPSRPGLFTQLFSAPPPVARPAANCYHLCLQTELLLALSVMYHVTLDKSFFLSVPLGLSCPFRHGRQWPVQSISYSRILISIGAYRHYYLQMIIQMICNNISIILMIMTTKVTLS